MKVNESRHDVPTFLQQQLTAGEVYRGVNIPDVFLAVRQCGQSPDTAPISLVRVRDGVHFNAISGRFIHIPNAELMA